MHTGESKTEGGRVGEQSARGLSASPPRTGLRTRPPQNRHAPAHRQRIHRLRRPRRPTRRQSPHPLLRPHLPTQHSALRLRLFPALPQVPMHITHTNHSVHDLIRANLHRAPMYSGQIQSRGPRYCPSIEDKVVRFADKDQPPDLPRTRRPRHQRNLLQRHLHQPPRRRAGRKSSARIPGLENAKILR